MKFKITWSVLRSARYDAWPFPRPAHSTDTANYRSKLLLLLVEEDFLQAACARAHLKISL